MLKKILSYGVIAGLIAGVAVSVTSITLGDITPTVGMAIGYTAMLIAFTAVFVGIKRYRDVELGGVIRFWPAFGMGVAMSVVASVLYVVAWEALVAATGMDFAGSYAATLIEQQKAAGVSGDELARIVAGMEQFKAEYANPLYRLAMTFVEIFPVGVLVSLVSAGLLRNRRFMPARRS
ncbi:MAG: DUF4199 domain-containing protein [Dokdonella sp.]